MCVCSDWVYSLKDLMPWWSPWAGVGGNALSAATKQKSPPMCGIILRPSMLQVRVTTVKYAGHILKLRTLAMFTWAENIETPNKSLLLQGLKEMMTALGGGRWQCVQCGFQSKSTNVKYHIEAKHMTSSERYSCQYCHELFKTRISLNVHMTRKHREVPFPSNIPWNTFLNIAT